MGHDDAALAVWRWASHAAPIIASGVGLIRSRHQLAPGLGLATLRRAWACLRTFAPDRVPVIGPDPRVGGLYWLAAFGGSGMSVGVGAGELLAALVAGRDHPLAATVGPSRLLVRSDGPA